MLWFFFLCLLVLCFLKNLLFLWIGRIHPHHDKSIIFPIPKKSTCQDNKLDQPPYPIIIMLRIFMNRSGINLEEILLEGDGLRPQKSPIDLIIFNERILIEKHNPRKVFATGLLTSHCQGIRSSMASTLQRMRNNVDRDLKEMMAASKCVSHCCAHEYWDQSILSNISKSKTRLYSFA